MTPATDHELEPRPARVRKFAQVSAEDQAKFKTAPPSWFPLWVALKRNLWHGDFARLSKSQLAEETGLEVRAIKRGLHAFEELGIVRIRRTVGGSMKNANWLQLVAELPAFEVPERLRRRRTAPPAAAASPAADRPERIEEVFGTPAAPVSALAATWAALRQLLAGELADDLLTVWFGPEIITPRAIVRGVLVLEVVAPYYAQVITDSFGALLERLAKRSVVVVVAGEAYPPAPAIEVDVDLEAEAARLVREFHRVVRGDPNAAARKLHVNELTLARGLLETHGAAAWELVGKAAAKVLDGGREPLYFTYLAPALVQLGAHWPGQPPRPERPRSRRR